MYSPRDIVIFECLDRISVDNAVVIRRTLIRGRGVPLPATAPHMAEMGLSRQLFACPFLSFIFIALYNALI